jgi:uncharacterized protein (DUF2147 family)
MSSYLLVLAVMLVPTAAPAGSVLEGHWRNPNGTVIIAIAPCGEVLCGRVQWASEKAIADASKGGTDPLVGAELLREIVPNGDGRWKARLFVPDLNKTSKAELRESARDQLKVTGCTVGRLLCKSQVWTRTEAH